MSHIKSIFLCPPLQKHASVHPLRGVNLDFPNHTIVLNTSVQIVVQLCHSYSEHSRSLNSFDRDVYQLFHTQMRMAYYFSFIILHVHISGGTLMRMAYYFSASKKKIGRQATKL